MMRKIYIYTPRLKIARLFTASIILDKADFIEELVLPYPRELKKNLLNFINSLISWRMFQKKIVELMGSYGYSWLDIEEPLLFTLKLLYEKNPSIDIILYSSLVEENEKYNVVTELISLALKTRLTNKINLEEWRKLIEKIKDKCAISNSILKSSKRVIIVLEKKSVSPGNAPLIEALPGYIESPLEKIVSANTEELEDTIRDYIEYVLDYLAKYSSVDYAYFKWIKDKGFKGLIVDLSDHYLKILSTMKEYY